MGNQSVQADNQLIDLKPKWYIVQTYVGFEDAVRKSLETKIQNLDLKDKILEIFIPLKKVVKLNKKGEKQEKMERVYPGYIYVRMILDKETGYVMQHTNYVSRITGTGDYALALEDGYVEKLKAELNRDDTDDQISITNFRISELVEVVDGPFKDMRGKIVAIYPKESELDVILTMFDRDTVVTLNVLEVRKVH